MNRRTFLHQTSISTLGIISSGKFIPKAMKDHKIQVLNPLKRVPVSFIIDDSTSLVNMAYYGIPQFGEVFPDRYKQDWRSLPREIPDSFVMEFIEWCDAHGVKGKYSMVPYPACTGWLNRFIPGWTKKELEASIKLVREYVTPNWDIHPEMISHTRVIDIKTGLPFPEASANYMENWEWSQDKSADELGEYIAYAHTILKEVGLHCEGLTTPGGFCHRNKDNLALATLEATREVHGTEIPHFFRDLFTEPDTSVEPQLYHVSGLETDDPKCAVHIIGCTGDWFGGWDGLTPGDVNRFITEDLNAGRMVEVIDKGEPAIMVCHWPGIYYNGEKRGFHIFQEVVRRLHQKYPNQLIWMKNSEIARYWAAKNLTTFHIDKKEISINAPFACPDFTIRLPFRMKKLAMIYEGERIPLQRVDEIEKIQAGMYYLEGKETVCCFDLPKGMVRFVD